MNRFLMMVGLVAALTAGCKSTPQKLPSTRCAYVTVVNGSAEQIAAKTRTVFQDQGYEPGRAEDDVLVFQKPGNFWKSLWYGDWYNGGVWERVRVYQHPQNSGQTLVDCDLFMVQGIEDPMFQKEKRLNGKCARLQKLLDEVAAAPASGK